MKRQPAARMIAFRSGLLDRRSPGAEAERECMFSACRKAVSGMNYAVAMAATDEKGKLAMGLMHPACAEKYAKEAEAFFRARVREFKALKRKKPTKPQLDRLANESKHDRENGDYLDLDGEDEDYEEDEVTCDDCGETEEYCECDHSYDKRNHNKRLPCPTGFTPL